MKYGPSKTHDPVARVRRIYAKHHETMSQKDMIDLCVKQGINRNTATTQIYFCRNQEKTADAIHQRELENRMNAVLDYIHKGPDIRTREVWYAEAHTMLSLAACREAH